MEKFSKKNNTSDFLGLAINLAAQTDSHKTAPNPRVGCVVAQAGKVVATGLHERFGEVHAEQQVLQKMRGSLRGHEIYVTLEPCDDFPGKKTPGCTDLLIQARPDKVIVGTLDPHFGGRSVAKLRKAGILVEVCEDEKCRDLNPFFEKFITTGMPYLTLKVAQSLDGKLQSPKGKWITNALSRQRVHEMRAKYSAILTTVQTVLEDDPLLNCRLEAYFRSFSDPQLIVLGQKSRIPKRARIFSVPDRQVHFFEERNIEDVLRKCGEMGIDSVMTECGPRMNRVLLESGFVDSVMFFVAPEVFGGQEGGSCKWEVVAANAGSSISCKEKAGGRDKAIARFGFRKVLEGFRLQGVECFGGDVLFEYWKR